MLWLICIEYRECHLILLLFKCNDSEMAKFVKLVTKLRIQLLQSQKRGINEYESNSLLFVKKMNGTTSINYLEHIMQDYVCNVQKRTDEQVVFKTV